MALLLCGGWEGHRPLEAARRFLPALERAGLRAVLADDLSVLADARRLAEAAVVVPNWTMGALTDAQEAALAAAVESGTGLAGWHGGMGDAFRDRPQYQFLAGGQFVAHPGGVRRYEVHIADGGHPITAGLADFAVTSEQYYMHVDPANHVLATTLFDGDPMPWIAGTVMPVAWKRRHGRGRVFYCSLGHAPEDFDVPEAFELVRRGLLWAAGLLGP